jgi:hypothetical protein
MRWSDPSLVDRALETRSIPFENPTLQRRDFVGTAIDAS